MTSNDVRDMLDLPSEAARPAKRAKISQPRPVLKGLAREVQNLGGDNPIAIVPDVSVYKKKRFANRKPAAKWELTSFTNSARKDTSLTLRHWRRKDETTQSTGPVDSTFAKYNVQVQVPRYDENQYKNGLENPLWTKEETDYLVDLVEQFDLRWPVIWDRYEYQQPIPAVEGEASATTIVTAAKPRTMEDLKSRYYTVAAKMMAVNTPLEQMKEAEFQLHELMLHFDPQQERVRKHYAEALLHRHKDEAREEESLLMELKRILARSEALSDERRELYARLEAPLSRENIGIYTSSQGLQQLLQQLMTADKSKKRRSLIEGASPAPGLDLSRGLAGVDRRDSNVRESISGPSGSSNKKGPSQGPSDRRQLSAEEEKLYGVSHHERLTTSGPAYRHEKISKPISSKSSIQQQKITNVLAELEIPIRLTMPTAEVGALFEELLGGVHLLLEARKLHDKLTGEINILKATKAEREAIRLEQERREQEPGLAQRTPPQVDDDAPTVSAPLPHKRSASALSNSSDGVTKKQKQ